MQAAGWRALTTAILALLIVAGSRRLDHFDAALVGYTFATLFATFGITYRYTMWLQRPPTRLYGRRGWQAFMESRSRHAVPEGREALSPGLARWRVRVLMHESQPADEP
jgi:hypothetical protein